MPLSVAESQWIRCLNIWAGIVLILYKNRLYVDYQAYIKITLSAYTLLYIHAHAREGQEEKPTCTDCSEKRRGTLAKTARAVMKNSEGDLQNHELTVPETVSSWFAEQSAHGSENSQ